ncbi:MAG: GNAT family N-acetyltransferase [Saprospiraceae bacterium]|nr:GNAT family N-acetyltransferase [Saprospiraceae bacterium]
MISLSIPPVTLELADYDRKLLAKGKGSVFVCNQVLSEFDEKILLTLLRSQYPHVRILYPYPVAPSKSIRDFSIRPKGGKVENAFFTGKVIKKLKRNVEKGLAVGLVLNFSDNPLNHWGKNVLRQQIIRQLRRMELPVTPIHLQMAHKPGSSFSRTIPGLSKIKKGDDVQLSIRVGNTISAEEIAKFNKSRLWGKFLQAKIFSLGSLFDVRPELFLPGKQTEQDPLAEAVEPAQVEAEMAALDPSRIVVTRGEFDVIVAPFSELPNTMFEIARLRELTFRAVGEGTGKSRDMDEFDMYYLQLIIWDRQNKRIVGGYRVGEGDHIFERFGVNGFYTSSLFKMKQGFHPLLRQTVELGRTYVVPDYQKHRLPLFLLWKGILHFLLANPKYRYLIGPVSISKDYSEVSKGVIVEFVKRFFYDKKLAQYITPRKPFRPAIKDVDTGLLAENLQGQFTALEALVESMEPAHFTVPVLFRQYLRQNAKFIGFNVDPNFADCLDGLMILDIRDLPEETLELLQQEK